MVGIWLPSSVQPQFENSHESSHPLMTFFSSSPVFIFVKVFHNGLRHHVNTATDRWLPIVLYYTDEASQCRIIATCFCTSMASPMVGSAGDNLFCSILQSMENVSLRIRMFFDQEFSSNISRTIRSYQSVVLDFLPHISLMSLDSRATFCVFGTLLTVPWYKLEWICPQVPCERLANVLYSIV